MNWNKNDPSEVVDFNPKIFYLIPKKTCSRKYHEYYFAISLSFSHDFKICDKHPGIYFFRKKQGEPFNIL